MSEPIVIKLTAGQAAEIGERLDPKARWRRAMEAVKARTAPATPTPPMSDRQRAIVTSRADRGASATTRPAGAEEPRVG